LGLAVAQTLIAQNHGTIDCESHPGRTVFFRFFFHFPPESHGEIYLCLDWLTTIAHSLGARKACSARISHAWCSIRRSDALRELERSQPAVVLSDIRMPGASGLELLQR